jgi:predicted enzyme involved in methoxymalonyl-ACP biosynthesis
MSCRVIGRNLEYKFFDEIVSKIKSMKMTVLTSEYVNTKKNNQVANFYEKAQMDFNRLCNSKKSTSWH